MDAQQEVIQKLLNTYIRLHQIDPQNELLSYANMERNPDGSINLRGLELHKIARTYPAKGSDKVTPLQLLQHYTSELEQAIEGDLGL